MKLKIKLRFSEFSICKAGGELNSVKLSEPHTESIFYALLSVLTLWIQDKSDINIYGWM